MSKQVDVARAKHRMLVDKHMRLTVKQKKELDKLLRIQKQIIASERAISRSQKRLDKYVAAMTANRGPMATAVPGLIEAVDAQEPDWGDLNDDVVLY